MKTLRISWPPKPEKESRIRRGMIQRYDGEPVMIPMKRWENDHTLRGSLNVECCDCGLRHVYTFEVLRAPNRKFYLVKRAYRL